MIMVLATLHENNKGSELILLFEIVFSIDNSALSNYLLKSWQLWDTFLHPSSVQGFGSRIWIPAKSWQNSKFRIFLAFFRKEKSVDFLCLFKNVFNILRSLNIKKKFSIFNYVFIELLLENEQILTNLWLLDPDPGDEEISDHPGSETLRFCQPILLKQKKVVQSNVQTVWRSTRFNLFSFSKFKLALAATRGLISNILH